MKKRTFLEKFFQFSSKLCSQLTLCGVMFEEGQDIVCECSRFCVASETKIQSRGMEKERTRVRIPNLRPRWEGG